MRPKKNPKVDLSRNTGLYFSFGLCLMLFLTWQALEMKTYERQTFTIEDLAIQEDTEEDIPIVDLKNLPPPPPPPSAPVLIEVIEDDSELVETIIESTETNADEVIDDAVVDVSDVEVEEEEEDVVVPFAVIEQVATFPGCEGFSGADLRVCFNEKMNKHIQKHFTYPDVAKELGVQGRVYVQFVIDRQGYVTGVRARGPDKTLEKEAVRIISKLPQFNPGKQRGKTVKMGFSIPITFKLVG